MSAFQRAGRRSRASRRFSSSFLSLVLSMVAVRGGFPLFSVHSIWLHVSSVVTRFFSGAWCPVSLWLIWPYAFCIWALIASSVDALINVVIWQPAYLLRPLDAQALRPRDRYGRVIRYSSRPCSSSSPWGLFHGFFAAYGSSYYLCGLRWLVGTLVQLASKLERFSLKVSVSKSCSC